MSDVGCFIKFYIISYLYNYIIYDKPTTEDLPSIIKKQDLYHHQDKMPNDCLATFTYCPARPLVTSTPQRSSVSVRIIHKIKHKNTTKKQKNNTVRCNISFFCLHNRWEFQKFLYICSKIIIDLCRTINRIWC